MDSQEQQTYVSSARTSRTRRAVGLALVIILVGAAVFRIGYISGSKGYGFDTQRFTITHRSDTSQQVDYSLLWKALGIVNDKYIDKDNIDQQQVLYGAIRGAVGAAGDDYTEFFDPKTLADFKTELQGTFSGIGAEIGKRDGSIVVIAPLEGSPAQQAGVAAKDIIVRIDGESTQDLSVDEVVNKIRGPEGSKVTLSLFREGKSAPFEVTITRQKIEIKSVTTAYREVAGKQIALVTISRFGDDTKDLFEAAVKEITEKNVSGLVLDLRNNPGGYLDTSVELASDWLPKGMLVVKEEHSNQKDSVTYNSLGYNRLGNIKTVTLINGGSASASEILAGALKDHGKTTLIGEKSFGKGSVQELVPVTSDTAVKVTVAKWITPSGKNLNKDGLHPDVEVKISDGDVTAGKDPQLDAALQAVIK